MSGAFVFLEVVFAILLVGIVFGIFAHFYIMDKKSEVFSTQDIRTTQEAVLFELKAKNLSKQFVIQGFNGELCEGELFEVNQNHNVFKLFEPKYCDK